MSTTTHYVVRNAEGLEFEERGDGYYGDANFGWGKGGDRYPSRAEAERLAAEHGGTVHRITVTDEAVGPLTWAESFGHCAAMLMDGNRCVHFIWLMPGGYGWEGERRQVFASLDEAKAAAEAAVRETWT